MAALIITRKGEERPFIVPFDPAKESQEDVEKHHSVPFSEYYDSWARANEALERQRPIAGEPGPQ